MTELERCAELVFGFLFRGEETLPVTDEKLRDSADDGFDWAWLNFGLSDHRALRDLSAPSAHPARQGFSRGKWPSAESVETVGGASPYLPADKQTHTNGGRARAEPYFAIAG